MKLSQSFRYALKGIRYVFRYEYNARIHLILAVLAIIFGLALNLSVIQLCMVVFAIIIVFIAEIFNTAIEETLDIIDNNKNTKIEIIKDISAGAVLVAAITAVIIGTIVFIPKLSEVICQVI